MKIDTEATKQRFYDTGRTITVWSRAKGFSDSTVHALINGKFQASGTISENIIKALEIDDLLVIAEDQEAA